MTIKWLPCFWRWTANSGISLHTLALYGFTTHPLRPFPLFTMPHHSVASVAMSKKWQGKKNVSQRGKLSAKHDATWWNLWKLNETMQVPKPEIKIHKVCHAGMTFNIQKQVWNTHINHNTTILTDTCAHTHVNSLFMDFSANVQICEKKTQKNTDIAKPPSNLTSDVKPTSPCGPESMWTLWTLWTLCKIDLVLDKKSTNCVSFFFLFEFVHSILHVA